MTRALAWTAVVAATFAVGWVAGATAWVCAAMAHEAAQGRP